MSKSPFLKTMLTLLMLALIFAACQPDVMDLPSQPLGTDTVETEAPLQNEVIATATAEPPKELTICIAQEPASLYRYDGRNSLAKQSLFAALYGPDEGRAWLLESSDQAIVSNQEAIDLEQGMTVLAADGTVQILRPGLKIFPAGGSEAMDWAADAGHQLLRSTIIYKLKPGLLWSDGQALTANDVLFSYHLARRLELPTEQWAMDRTATLEALDETTLRWVGIPGFKVHDEKAFLWKPLPAHLLETLPDATLPETDHAALTPPGWSAWRMTTWEKGSRLSFEKNPHFSGDTSSASPFETLNFLVVPELEQALAKLDAKECQILDKSYQLEALEDARLLDLATRHQLVVENYDLVEQLVFNTHPISGEARQNLLAEAGTRQAISACLQDASVITKLLGREWFEARVVDGVDLNQLGRWPELPDAAAKLEENGWTLAGAADGVRVAQGVPNVEDGSALRLTLLTGQGAQSMEIAGLISETLKTCGIAVTHQSMPAAELYAPGPDGPIFGRKFDMALINWGPQDEPLCELYVSGQIPSSDNHWIGTNIAGLNSQSYDYLCTQGAQDGHEAISHSAPAIALAPQVKVWLASADLVLPPYPQFEFLNSFMSK